MQNHEKFFNSEDLNRRFFVLDEREKIVVHAVIIGYGFKSIAEDNKDLFANTYAVKRCYKTACEKMHNG